MKKTKFIFVTMILILSIVLSVSVSAITSLDLYNGFTNGHYQATAYFRSYLSTDYHVHFSSALGNWSGISPRSVTGNSTSSNGLYDENFVGHSNSTLVSYSSAYGLRIVISRTTNCSKHTSLTANIFINRDVTLPNGSSYIKYSVIAHEMGHALGLNDITGKDSSRLMDGNRDRTKVYMPTALEKQAVKDSWAQCH